MIKVYINLVVNASALFASKSQSFYLLCIRRPFRVIEHVVIGVDVPCAVSILAQGDWPVTGILAESVAFRVHSKFITERAKGGAKFVHRLFPLYGHPWPAMSINIEKRGNRFLGLRKQA